MLFIIHYETFEIKQQYHEVQLDIGWVGLKWGYGSTGKLGRAWVGTWVGAWVHGGWVFFNAILLTRTTPRLALTSIKLALQPSHPLKCEGT